MIGRRGSDPSRLAGLKCIAALRKDAALAEFARAAEAREAVLAQIRSFDDAAAAGRAAARLAADAVTLAAHDSHARALTLHRATANLSLARQTALWLEWRDRAAIALGRDDTLDRVVTNCARARALMRARRSMRGD